MKQKMINGLLKIKYTLQRIYRVCLPFEKRQRMVWKDLKKLCVESGWKYGTYEEDKFVEMQFELANDRYAKHYYFVLPDRLSCRVKVVDEYEHEKALDVFILAQHFNNELNNGKVVVDAGDRTVEYIEQRSLLAPLLYNDDIFSQMQNHNLIAKDVYACYQRLLIEDVEPAIIIADLMSVRRG
jgi:hypothetical protein